MVASKLNTQEWHFRMRDAEINLFRIYRYLGSSLTEKEKCVTKKRRRIGIMKVISKS